jgi:hypothetical protein
MAGFLDVAEKDVPTGRKGGAGHLGVHVGPRCGLLQHDQVSGDGLGAGLARPAQQVLGGAAVLGQNKVAVGRDVLREAGKRDLGGCGPSSTRTPPPCPGRHLRYAIDHLDADERRRYRSSTTT